MSDLVMRLRKCAWELVKERPKGLGECARSMAEAANVIDELDRALRELRLRSSWCYDRSKEVGGKLIDDRSNELIAAEAAADAILSRLGDAS